MEQQSKPVATIESVAEMVGDVLGILHIMQDEGATKTDIKELEVRFDKKFVTLENKFDTLENKFGSLENKFGILEDKFDTLETKVDTGFASLRADHEGMKLSLEKLQNKTQADDDALISDMHKLERKTNRLDKLNQKFSQGIA